MAGPAPCLVDALKKYGAKRDEDITKVSETWGTTTLDGYGKCWGSEDEVRADWKACYDRATGPFCVVMVDTFKAARSIVAKADEEQSGATGRLLETPLTDGEHKSLEDSWDARHHFTIPSYLQATPSLIGRFDR